LGVQFLGLGYYYPSTEKIDRSTQFGAVGYIITLYSSKSYVKSWGSVQIFGGPDPLTPPLVVAPILKAMIIVVFSSYENSQKGPKMPLLLDIPLLKTFQLQGGEALNLLTRGCAPGLRWRLSPQGPDPCYRLALHPRKTISPYALEYKFKVN